MQKKKKKHVRSKFLNAGNVGKQVSLQVDNNEKEVLKQQRHWQQKKPFRKAHEYLWR